MEKNIKIDAGRSKLNLGVREGFLRSFVIYGVIVNEDNLTVADFRAEGFIDENDGEITVKSSRKYELTQSFQDPTDLELSLVLRELGRCKLVVV